MVNRCNQFPIVPAYAATVHKSQGLTLKYVIIDFKQNSKKAVPCGAFYTAITRVRSLKNIFLRNFDKSYIRTDNDVLQEIDRLKTVPYQFVKPYLNDSVFKNCPKELKVSYLNSNGLLNKLEDVRADYNLMRSDIICLSETKMNKSVSNKILKLETFEICSRLDSQKQSSGGMIVYAKKKICPYITVIENRYNKRIENINNNDLKKDKKLSLLEKDMLTMLTYGKQACPIVTTNKTLNDKTNELEKVVKHNPNPTCAGIGESNNGKSKIISCITQRDCLSNSSSSETSMLYLIKLIKALDNKAPEDIEIKLSKSSYNILMKFY